MAHLWIEDTGGWAVFPLPADGRVALPPAQTSETVWLERAAGAGSGWLLVCGGEDDVVLNGLPLATGIRVLEDRDEIRLPGAGRCFFSTERLAEVRPYSGDGMRRCPRCRRPLEAGDSSVRCPSCDLQFHQTDAFPCWTHDPTCLCGHPTDFDGRYRWNPENL